MLVMPVHSTNSQNCFVGIGISGCNEPLYRRSILRLTLTVNLPLSATTISVHLCVCPGPGFTHRQSFPDSRPKFMDNGVNLSIENTRNSANHAEEGCPPPRTRARWTISKGKFTFQIKKNYTKMVYRFEDGIFVSWIFFKSEILRDRILIVPPERKYLVHPRTKVTFRTCQSAGAMPATLDGRREGMEKNNPITRRNDRFEETRNHSVLTESPLFPTYPTFQREKISREGETTRATRDIRRIAKNRSNVDRLRRIRRLQTWRMCPIL